MGEAHTNYKAQIMLKSRSCMSTFTLYLQDTVSVKLHRIHNVQMELKLIVEPNCWVCAVKILSVSGHWN